MSDESHPITTLTVNPLFKGLTRPAMFMGVHSTYMIIIITVALLLLIWLQMLAGSHLGLLLLSPLTFGVLYGVGRVFCWREPHIFHLLGQTEPFATKNQRYYKGCNTYEPY